MRAAAARAAFRPALPVRLLFLAAAYSPLLLLLAVLDLFGVQALRWLFAAVCVAGIAATAVFLRWALPRRNAVTTRVHEASPREGEALKFFASYVVPFFVTAAAPPSTRWALLVYLVLIAVLYLQSDLYYANPLFALLGYRVFDVSRRERDVAVVLSRSWHLAADQQIRLVHLGGYVFVDLGPPEGNSP
ncbi:hypothetical protein [Nakamurella endophytica]|uniref:Uncharacterized protein n=1 Tax=Nakamurella endophytica TaxID=1748367 RepID=A0A917SLB7_9ACTN|nr:hypothetical protein [Nakamurella endophytica]GGL85362.1 hypothetical protein GCM10011594_01310 [Nakamurella endophytica]